MITFKTVRWKNFLSTGNAFTEVNLNVSPSTLVVGSNGAGKSTMLDAICFALFNKPFRKITKSQLVNSVNEKDAVVEVYFDIGSAEYKVVRGIKPNKFEITKNGTVLNQDSAVKDQQVWLEQSVLKLNYKSFTQVVILGSSTFVPFMQLSASARREVIEDLLDIKIFSTMNNLLKDRVRAIKDSLRDVEYNYELCKERVEIQQRFISDLKSQSKANNAQRKEQIKSLEDEISVIVENIGKFNIAIETLQEESNKMNSSVDTHSELKIYQAKFKDKKKRLNSDYKFFSENDTCPTCKQSIDKELKDSKIESISKSLEELSGATEKLQENIEYAAKMVQKHQTLLGKIQNYQNEVTSNNKEIQWKRQAIQKIEESIEETTGGGANVKREQEKLKAILKEGMEVETRISGMKKDRDNHDVITNLLKDTGIKSQIIKRYLPVMNQLINRYLKELDFYVSFELDENFSETIKSRYRDDFCYSSFSEGEKMRIDLALLFTWRMIAKMKNSACTNLLILDEIFDSSLDLAGTDDFMKILRSFSDNTNVFVISHKPDVLQDKFNRILRVEKKQNFSVVSEESGL